MKCNTIKSQNQKQSFSGVGAQHMNTRAERSIGIVVGMARTFMIHVALHWADYKVDDISLWPFAIKHAAWLYIRLPNQITGIPLEMLTREKATHKDLLRSHVWGCPTFCSIRNCRMTRRFQSGTGVRALGDSWDSLNSIQPWSLTCAT